ncbi:MAG TPA: class I SAM-dependent methyltransferase [Anaerolineales bacterium]|nr:class I SAM-dependent methyltransferase [Anaerolineales bacterium]
MPIIVEHCPLCGDSRSTQFDQRRFRDQVVTNRLCLRCGFVFQSPRMTDIELADFYQAEYRRLYQGSAGPNAKDLAVQRGRAQVLVEFTRRVIKPGIRHLDIGCSSGLLLQEFASAFTSTPTGIEPGDAYRSYARAQGLPVYASLDALLADQPEQFNLISMAHVLEHIAEPVAYLSNLREKLLAPDGWLLLEVPNLYAHDSFEIAHLLAFSPHTLAETVRQAGFQISIIRQTGLPRSSWIPLYIQLLAQPDPAAGKVAVKQEKLVGLKRQLGLVQRRLLTRLFPQRAWQSPDSSQVEGRA